MPHAKLLIATVLLVILSIPTSLLALQYGGTPQPGLFGPGRTFGQGLTPQPNYFNSRIQRGPSGEFRGIGQAGSEMFDTQWGHYTRPPAPLIYLPPSVTPFPGYAAPGWPAQ